MTSAPISSEVIRANVTSAHERSITLEAAEALINLSGTTTSQSEPSLEDKEIQTNPVDHQPMAKNSLDASVQVSFSSSLEDENNTLALATTSSRQRVK